MNNIATGAHSRNVSVPFGALDFFHPHDEDAPEAGASASRHFPILSRHWPDFDDALAEAAI